MPTILLIRHGESQANAGVATLHPKTVELTEKGWEQARSIAEYLYQEKPLDFILISSFRRAKQTALPTLALFPSVPREVSPVHEFTYLGLQHNIPSTVKERLPLVQNYWEECKPWTVKGQGSESFADFIKRVKQLQLRLKERRYPSVAVFSHEQFICAFLWSLQQGWLNLTQNDMKGYREFFLANRIPNGGIVQVQFDDRYTSGQYELLTSHLHTWILEQHFECYAENPLATESLIEKEEVLDREIEGVDEKEEALVM
jgi:2,3-bisphosphoglycerate-dependent phosphoglycerate mutase